MEKRIKYRDADLSYADIGEGPCVVLLHGYLESGAIWRSFMESFPGECRFIVPDLPGHGASGTWGKVHGMDELAGILGIERNTFGFFKTTPENPLDTTKEGIFVCGCSHSPMDIPESVAQASSAASRAVQAVTVTPEKLLQVS